MAFLDNSGDIILDAVLTDTGRFRLAKGDGSFKIVKFALSDDEINYALYDKTSLSGSAYYDLQILQTPILEAFTNNASSMNYKLLSIPRTNLLYLPMMKINSQENLDHSRVFSTNQGYIVSVTQATYDKKVDAARSGYWNGETLGGTGANKIRIDQGIDNGALPWYATIDSDLKETQYIVEIDSRLGFIASPANGTPANVSYIDDDNIASYYLSMNDGAYVTNIKGGPQERGYRSPTTGEPNIPEGLTISGPQGTSLLFSIGSTLELRSSNYLFNTIGSTLTAANNEVWNQLMTGNSYKYIDTIVKVTGATTGYKLNLPVRFIKRTGS